MTKSITIFGIDTYKICEMITNLRNTQTGFSLQKEVVPVSTKSKQRRFNKRIKILS